MKIVRSSISATVLFVISIAAANASVTKNIVLQGGATAITQITVLVHNALPVTARFKVKRDGPDTDFALRACSFRLISPPGGSIASLANSIGATEETFDLRLGAAGGANALAQWRVEVKNAEAAGNSEVSQAVRGTVEIFTTGSTTATIPAPARFGLVQSGSAAKTISMPFTGDLTIQANWDTDEISLENYQLKFELYKGSTLLGSDTGYSRDSIILGISDSQRMKISHRVNAADFQMPGDWKVKVYGSSKGKVKNVDLKMKISDGLYE